MACGGISIEACVHRMCNGQDVVLFKYRVVREASGAHIVQPVLSANDEPGISATVASKSLKMNGPVHMRMMDSTLVYVSSGDLAPVSIAPTAPARAYFFTMPIDTSTIDQCDLRRLARDVCDSAVEPMVAYHGSGSKSLLKVMEVCPWRLEPSADGMMGPGVYLGTPFKALRFAAYKKKEGSLQQGWAPRVGASDTPMMVRAFVSPSARVEVMRPITGWDDCEDAVVLNTRRDMIVFACTNMRRSGKGVLMVPLCISHPRTSVSDMDPSALSMKHDGRRWLCKNAEMCVDAEHVHLQDAAVINVSALGAMEPYNPWIRVDCVAH